VKHNYRFGHIVRIAFNALAVKAFVMLR